MGQTDNYREYLSSDEWRHKCRFVHKRSGGFCARRGCVNPADDVHHYRRGDTSNMFPQDYRYLRKETLADLVHLCRGCHRFVHGKTAIDPVVQIDRLVGKTCLEAFFRGIQFEELQQKSLEEIKSIHLANLVSDYVRGTTDVKPQAALRPCRPAPTSSLIPRIFDD